MLTTSGESGGEGAVQATPSLEIQLTLYANGHKYGIRQGIDNADDTLRVAAQAAEVFKDLYAALRRTQHGGVSPIGAEEVV